MAVGTQRGALVEERAQLELQLTQEEFFCNNIPQRRQMAIMGVVIHIIVLLVFALFVVGVFTMGFAGFNIVVGAVLALFWIVWFFISGKEWMKDLKYLGKSACEAEIATSMAKQQRYKAEIDRVTKELESIPISTWNG